MEAIARANKQTVSEWVRIALPLEAAEEYNGYAIYLATRRSKYCGGFESAGWIANKRSGAEPIPVVSPGGHPTKRAALDYGIAWSRERIDAPLKQDKSQS
jgi:hypothetical protein